MDEDDSLDKNVDAMIMFVDQQVTVFNIVPRARTSSGISSVPIQAIVATPELKHATYTMIQTSTSWPAHPTLSLLSSSVLVSIGMYAKDTAAISMQIAMPRTVIVRRRLRPNLSTRNRLTIEKMKLVPETVIATAVALEKPTMEKSVAE